MQNHSGGWMQAGSDIRARVGTMRAPSRRWVMACAWLIRQIVMHAPGVAWEVRRKDVTAFLVTHPGEWDHRTADHLFLIEILAGRVGPSVDQLVAAA